MRTNSLILTVVLLAAGCAAKDLQRAKADEATAAEDAYATELLRCVDQNKTRDESHACRAAVNVKWGVTLDGGAK